MSIIDITTIESPISMLEGETITYSLTWQGSNSLSSPTVLVFKDGTDYTSTAMPSGSHSVSGNVQTFKPLVTTAGTDGGKRFVVIIQCVVDSNTERRKLLVNIRRQDTEV